MFGGEKSKKPVQDWVFDLENELQGNPIAQRKRKEEIEAKTQKIKSAMRQGSDKSSFDRSQTILNGYIALQKVFNRIK